MGGRCLTPAVVIDLDGTLVATNTFRNYILFASKLSLRQGRIDIAIGCTAPVVCRKLRLITHSCMKRLILRQAFSYRIVGSSAAAPSSTTERGIGGT